MKDGRFPLAILLYTEGLPFTGAPIEHQALGGSESALWFMARELSKRGPGVDVCCHWPAPGTFADGAGHDITYYDTGSFPQMQYAKEWTW
jgi:hypothetical protein